MKNLFLSLLFLFSIYSLESYSQDFWEQLYFPDTTDIFCIAVNEDSHIFIGAGGSGNSGGVYHSENEGVSWDFLGIENRTVYSIAVNTSGEIYAGASQGHTSQGDFNGGLHRSTDDGFTWEVLDTDVGVYGNILVIKAWGDTLFASLWGSLGASVIRSTDNGESWGLWFTTNNPTEYASDIIRSNSGTIYLGLRGYFEGMGGVFKTEDHGETFEFLGLYNHMVSSLALNSSNDLFAGSWGWLDETASSGLFVLRNGEEEWDDLVPAQPQVSATVVNSEDHIFFTSAFPNGVVRSLDNGSTFELVNEGLPIGPMGDMVINDDGFLYVSSHYSSNFLAKSINPTVSIQESNVELLNSSWEVYPNPVNDILNIKPINQIERSAIVKINIYNTAGRLILTSECSNLSEHYHLNITDLPSGLYIVEVVSNDFKNRIKFIVK
jgi:hypothetical protein